MMKINTQKLMHVTNALKDLIVLGIAKKDLKNYTKMMKFQILNNQLEIMDMDYKHICLFDYIIDFDECTIDKSEFVVNIDSFYSILKNIKDESITLEILPDQLKITSDHSEAFIDLDKKEEFDNIDKNALTQLDFVQSIELNYKDFERMIIQSKEKSEIIEFEVESNNVKYLLKNEKAIMKNTLDSIHSEYTRCYSQFNCSYSVLFMHEIRKTLNFLKIGLTNKEKSQLSFTLKLMNEGPMMIKCNNYHNSSIEVYLAPRVEEDSDSDYDEIESESESIQQIHSDPVLSHKIEINTTIMQAQIEKAKIIDDLYESIGQLNALQNTYEEKLLKLHDEKLYKSQQLLELEKSFI